jgi:hypothetical protein
MIAFNHIYLSLCFNRVLKNSYSCLITTYEIIYLCLNLRIKAKKVLRTLPELVYSFSKICTYSASIYWLCVALR